MQSKVRNNEQEVSVNVKIKVNPIVKVRMNGNKVRAKEGIVESKT